jgi:uncharacterized protein YqhQ
MQIGGQAVIEGVMMRAPGMVATAVRRVGGEIEIKKEAYTSLAERYPVFKLPILRGAVGLIEMMVVGIRTLNYSAEVAMRDAENGEHQPLAGPRNGHASRNSTRREKVTLGLTVAVALLIGVAVFFVTPLMVATFLFDVEQEALWFNIVSGIVRIVLLLAYLTGISMMKDIKRLFEYHGAEHKAVFAFEHGLPLDLASAAQQSRFHPRCGTSFVLIVMIVAILVFSFLDAVLIAWLGELDIVTRLITHLPLIPVVGGVSYEFIKASARRSATPLGRLVVAPGLWLQRITTREPDEGQLEVALAALKAALSADVAEEPSVAVPQTPGLN